MHLKFKDNYNSSWHKTSSETQVFFLLREKCRLAEEGSGLKKTNECFYVKPESFRPFKAHLSFKSSFTRYTIGYKKKVLYRQCYSVYQRLFLYISSCLFFFFFALRMNFYRYLSVMLSMAFPFRPFRLAWKQGCLFLPVAISRDFFIALNDWVAFYWWNVKWGSLINAFLYIVKVTQTPQS